MKSLTVKEFLAKKKEALSLEILTGDCGLTNRITLPEVNRPGVAFSGYLEYFPYQKIQVLGNSDIFYMRSLSQEKLSESIKSILKYKIPCFISTRKLIPPKEMIDECIKSDIPFLSTSIYTGQLISEVSLFLDEVLSQKISIHGVLVEVYGLGILITGNSGIGKSECALELIKRGHKLVTDDLVTMRSKSGTSLIGESGPILKHHMEIRGLGIIDVKTFFGVMSVVDKTTVDMVIKLGNWDDVISDNFNRLGLDEKHENILGVKVPFISIPVKPGRNIAIIIEVAAMNERLKKEGYNSAMESDKKLKDFILNKTDVGN